MSSMFSQGLGARKKMKTKTNIPDLTEDLLMDILSRLRVKLILRYRSICKPWLSLLSDPRFFKLHLDRSKLLKTPNALLVQTLSLPFYRSNFWPPPSPTHLQTLTLDNSDFLNNESLENLNLESIPRLRVVGSCNGLFCLSDWESFTSLLNPSTREYLQLPPFGPIFKSHVCTFDYLKSVSFGFGYVSSSEEYKVVLVATSRYCSVTFEFGVYTIGTDSWRKIEAAPSFLCSLDDPLARHAHVNGVLHWICTRGTGFQPCSAILAFDLANEMFGEVPWPNFDMASDTHSLAELEGCLVTVCYSKFSARRVDIWMMKAYGVKESWVKLFSIRGPIVADNEHYGLMPFLIQKNGELLLQLETANRYFAGLDYLPNNCFLRFYDPVAETDRVPLIRGFPDKCLGYAYVETLTSIASLMRKAISYS